ncbi:hypothetical protein JZ751_024734 [Albula glossodonta]|uniref:Uncharacterized protein n=1 Tax=Albula glossodonta TaxID=121402 RepID=A0A8T2PE86_9TELE|nr:hypothetical protein JZ751_024734 [Albula glossodonta]
MNWEQVWESGRGGGGDLAVSPPPLPTCQFLTPVASAHPLCHSPGGWGGQPCVKTALFVKQRDN